MIEAFKVFDTDKSGYINKKELMAAFKTLGQPLPEKEVKEIFKSADKNGDGKLDIDGE